VAPGGNSHRGVHKLWAAELGLRRCLVGLRCAGRSAVPRLGPRVQTRCSGPAAPHRQSGAGCTARPSAHSSSPEWSCLLDRAMDFADGDAKHDPHRSCVGPRSRRYRGLLGACPRALPATEITTNERVGFRSKPTHSFLFRLFHHRPGSTQTSGNRSFAVVTLGSLQDIELVLVEELVPATAKVGTRAVVIDQRSGQGRPSDPILRDELRFIASCSSHDPLYSSRQAPSHPSRGSEVRRGGGGARLHR
jgi:hypothetical protein